MIPELDKMLEGLFDEDGEVEVTNEPVAMLPFPGPLSCCTYSYLSFFVPWDLPE